MFHGLGEGVQAFNLITEEAEECRSVLLASLVYLQSSWTAGTIEKDPVSKTKLKIKRHLDWAW